MAVLERQTLETGLALAHAISLERVLTETAQQVRRLTDAEAVAIALARGGAVAPTLMHQSGFDEEPGRLGSRLADSWREAMELRESDAGSGRGIVREQQGRTEITVPLSAPGVRGACTVLLTDSDAAGRADEIERALATIVPHLGAAVERAHAVELLLEKRRMETIGEVVAGISHELRNPLYGISSAAQLLRFRVKEDPVVEKNVGRILRETERMNAMVSALLEYARPAPLQLERGDPDEVWAGVIAEHRGLLESKALMLRHAPVVPRARCSVDAGQLAQAFGHLLDNAVDATPEGTDLTLLSAVRPDGSWRCQLHNGGPPIAADSLPRVFDLFYSTKPGAAGIGLALSRRIIGEHGGALEIESNAEAGTTVSVTLPARAAYSV
ncbi:MAG TPA: HAMP domain-containing sensor histidine kinase [Gemmatimonadaceae bacterium]|nr:HAMP domain-containing sensor histidine kinase [Gemmatimonadaceae bacterium]